MTDHNTFAQTETPEASDWNTDNSFHNKEAGIPQTLPSSKEDTFWGKDSHRNTVDVEQLTQQTLDKINQLGTHQLRIEGQHFVCTSCPFTHTVSLSTAKYTLDIDGNVIPIDKVKTI